LSTGFERKTLCKNFKNLRIADDFIVWEIASNNGSTKQQILITRDVVPLIMDLLHYKMGHLGKDQTASLVTESLYWAKMRIDIQTWLEECHPCTMFHIPANQRAELVNAQTSFPLELVCMDYLTIEPCKGGVQNILFF
jgi:hypothetical protein